MIRLSPERQRNWDLDDGSQPVPGRDDLAIARISAALGSPKSQGKRNEIGQLGKNVAALIGIAESRFSETRSSLELQADCFAGVWGHAAYDQGKVSGAEIADALDAAAATAGADEGR